MLHRVATFAFCALLIARLSAAPVAGSPGVALRIVHIAGGPRMAVWFPSSPQPSSRRERHPVVVFSHGWGGCGTQSLVLTESLARAGYVVAAPDHRDATCSVDGPRVPRFHLPQLPFSAPGRWKESTYDDRRLDLEKALDWLLARDDFSGLIDPARIGAMGHSLGGYSVLGLAGGWDSWKDPRITAVLALAPYVRPLLLHNRLPEIGVPVMYQDAQIDLGITQFLRGPDGAFAQTKDPKYLVELRGGNHFEWTNAVCFGHSRTTDCLEKRANPRLIVDYGVAFFDCYLKQRPEVLRQMDGAGLRAYRHSAPH